MTDHIPKDVPVPFSTSGTAPSHVPSENAEAEGVLKVTTRHTYQTSDSLSPTSVDPSPLEQFKLWFKEAQDDERVFEPEVMTLCTTALVPSSSSTSSMLAIPSSRIVLLKTLDSRGFILYTNYTSRKSRELLANPYASLTFYWEPLHRQVRVVGRAEKVSKEESEAYFLSRPVGSRVGAWASRQSSVVGEGELEGRVGKLEKRFRIVGEDGGKVQQGGEVPLPDFWGGWRIVPQ